MTRKVSVRQLALFDLFFEAPRGSLPAPAPPVEPLPVDEATRRAARELAGDLVLRAGAGTGKTHTLVGAVTHLVAGVTRLGRRVPLGGVLVLTFSEKAAGELRDRVRARFLELAAAPRADRELEAATREARAIALGAEAWRGLASSVGAAAITTFHGFAAALLRRHAAAAGLDPGFSILDEDESLVLLRGRAEEAILAALDESPDEIAPLVRELDFARPPWGRGRALVEHVIAVAERLREDGRPAAQLMLACDELAEAEALRAAGATAYAAALDELIAALTPTATTAASVRQRWSDLVALRQAVAATLGSLATEEDPLAHAALARVADRSGGNLGASPARKEAREKLRAAEATLQKAHAAHRAVPLGRAFVGLVDRALVAYAAAKTALGVLDFADLVIRARDLLAGDGAVRAAEAERHQAILVDELQDTNQLGDELVTLLRKPGAPLLAVGDPKQSIYEFRGADVAVFAAVAERVAAGGGQVLSLTESRRGRAPLTHFVNRLFARTMRGGAHRFEITFDAGADALHAHRGGDGACVELLEVADPDREPAAVARHIRALVDGKRPRVCEPDPAGRERERPARYRDIAVLLRRFTHLERYLRELRAAGVPHYVVNGRGFYEAQEVRDLVHALGLLDDPDDPVAALAVLRSPLVGLSDIALFALSQAAGGRLRLTPWLDAAAVFPDALTSGERERLADFAALLRRLTVHADGLGAAGVLRAIVEETDVAAVLATTHHGEQRVANLERLLSIAAAHDDEGRGDRATLARRLRVRMARPRSLAAPAQIVDERDDVVRVMTVHQAKGLEFPVVFVPDCGAVEREPTEPVVYDRDAGLGLRLRTVAGDRVASPRAERATALRRLRAAAESARIFYVAVTRARDLLVLSGANASPAARTWRGEVDGLLAEDPEARSLVTAVTVDTAAPLPPVVAPPPTHVAAAPAELPPSLDSPPTAARVVVAPVTELADLAACPRRYQLRHDLRLEEPPYVSGELTAKPPRSPREIDSGLIQIRTLAPLAAWRFPSLELDAADRGTLAHRLLEHIDLASWPRRGPAALREVLEALGESPDDPDAALVARRVGAFLDAPFGRALCARSGGVRREVPFAFAVDRPGAPRLLVKGQMDLVLVDDDRVTVVDYKLSRPGDAAPGAYRLQLLTYAAAARALWGRAARVGLVYLRAPRPEPELLSVDDAALDAAIDELSALGGALAEARQRACFPGRELATCRALRCGFIAACHEATDSRG